MSLARFTLVVLGILVSTTLVVALLVRGREDAGAFLAAVAAGAVLAGFNAIGAFALVLWSRERSTVAFMRAILGGMTLRMLLMLGAAAIALRVFALPQAAFLPSLLGHFALLLALELLAAHHTVQHREIAR